jgi:hypothetical protein
MPTRLIAASMAALVVLSQPGCAVTRVFDQQRPNPLVVPNADFETVWKQTVAIVDEYFDIASEDRLARKITTQPRIGATLIEPWLGDSVGFRERLESSLQTIRRFAIISIDPGPTGSYVVKVEVYKELEDMIKPDRQIASRATFNYTFPIQRTHDVVGPVPVPAGWISRGRDPKLEQVILNRISRRLFVK